MGFHHGGTEDAEKNQSLGFIRRDKSLDRSAATLRLLRWVTQSNLFTLGLLETRNQKLETELLT